MRFEWRKGSKYFRASLEQDLFGNWMVLSAWGRGRAEAGRKLTPCRDREHGLQMVESIRQRRRRYAYIELPRPVSWSEHGFVD